MALSPSFNAPGWLAPDAALLEDIGQVYFTDAPGAWEPFDMVIAEDAFTQALPAAGAALAPVLERLSGLASSVERAVLAPQGLKAWFEVFRTIEFAEAWATHAAWIGRAGPALKSDIRGRFEEGPRIRADEVAAATAARRAITDRLDGVVGGGRVLVLPTAGFLVRVFIIFHDAGHGSFFRKGRWNRVIGNLAGVMAFPPISALDS